MKVISDQKFMIEVSNIQSFHLDSFARENIKYYMKKQKISQRKMAEIANGDISYGFIKILLSGQTSTISKDKLMVICEILDIKPHEIFSHSFKMQG